MITGNSLKGQERLSSLFGHCGDHPRNILLLTLTQWMKKLPATLFVMVGRPAEGQDERKDSIRAELTDPHRGLPVTCITLGDFPEQAARNYLIASPTAKGVTGEELEKLVRLTRGHPLWLAFTIAYLWERGVPEEAEKTPLATIERGNRLLGADDPEGDEPSRGLQAPTHDALPGSRLLAGSCQASGGGTPRALASSLAATHERRHAPRWGLQSPSGMGTAAGQPLDQAAGQRSSGDAA